MQAIILRGQQDIPQGLSEYPEWMARLLQARGIESREAAEAFLHPCREQILPPLLLNDMAVARDLLLQAISGSKRIVIYGDYDCDGVCACAMAETTEVILTCTGDFMPGSNDRIKNEDFAFQRYIEQYGWGYPFEKLQVLFAKDDITLVNLECMLNDSAKDSTSRLRFRGPESYAAIFPASSIEVANLANNHAADFGKGLL